MATAPPPVSIVMCAHNPRRDLLAWSLSSIESQTLPSQQFEVLVVDNASRPPLRREEFSPGLRPRIQLLREERPGLAFARCAGIRAARGELIVFVDDDNFLAPDFLVLATQIASAGPHLGCFGGISRAVLERPLSPSRSRLLGYFGVRDYGPVPITSRNPRWGQWEPIGAGMVCRRAVAGLYADWVSTRAEARALGRSGRNLMSGDDSLLAQAAYELGLACSYQPRLSLAHWIKPGRLKLRFIARTLAGHGRSHVVLQALKGEPIPRPPAFRAYAGLLQAFRRRTRKAGLVRGGLEWFLDVGYVREARK